MGTSPSSYIRVPPPREQTELLVQFSWVVVFYVKVNDCCFLAI